MQQVHAGLEYKSFPAADWIGAPHSLQILAAVSTSGSIPPLAFLNVAI